jgi:predicted  nucleic acid-binding Zn-ribbon protein
VSTPDLVPAATRGAASAHGPLVLLHDLDLLLREIQDSEARLRLKRLGFAVDHTALLERARARLAGTVDRRWMTLYDRARHRYGRGVVSVRSRVCLGCFVTLPTSAQPRPGEPHELTVCESCGRILYWG